MELIARARQLASRGSRTLLGITGPPGAGKSTLAATLIDELGPQVAALAAMDGFHVGDALLVERGLRGRKGAPETFDRAGFAAALRRLRVAEDTVYLPRFDRSREDLIAAAIAIPADVPLVITEGNYLLLWPEVAELLDECWYLDVADAERVQRLIHRRMLQGCDETEALRWAEGSDQRNASVVATTRSRATVCVSAGGPWEPGRVEGA